MEYTKQVIMDREDEENFINKYLADPDSQCYQLDDGSLAYAGDKVYAGINGKFFKDLESYGLYLAEYHGYETFKLPNIRKEHL